jgi:hypothetical protein
VTLPETRHVLDVVEDVFVVHGRDNIAAFDLLIDDLGGRCGVSVTGRWAWLRASIDQEGVQSSACLLASEDGLRGAAVFVHHVDADGVRQVRLASGGDGHRAFLLAEDDTSAVALGVGLADVLTATDGPTRVSLGPLPSGDPTLESLLLSLPAAADVTFDEEVVPSVRAEGSALDDYLSHGMRRTLRKSNNRLATDGVTAEFTVTSNAHEIIQTLPEIAAVSRDRDHAGGRSSLLDEEAGLRRWTQRFVGLARLCHLELSTVLLDGSPAAYVLGVVDHGVYRVLEGRYVQDWKRYAPGRLLEAHVLERVLERPDLHELDWMTSAAPETLLAANAGADVVTADIVL